MQRKLTQEQSEFISLIGPGGLSSVSSALIGGLKANDVKVTRIGNGRDSLTESDMNRFYDAIKQSNKPKIVIHAHGDNKNGAHRILQRLKKEHQDNSPKTVDTQEIVLKAAKAAQNKNIEIILFSCFGGAVISDIMGKLPPNCSVISLVDKYYVLDFSTVFSLAQGLNHYGHHTAKQTNLTANQIVLFTLLWDAKDYKSMPIIYPEQNYNSILDHLYILHERIGYRYRNFTALEKEIIKQQVMSIGSCSERYLQKCLTHLDRFEQQDLEYTDFFPPRGMRLAIALICARNEKYQFNTNVLSTLFKLLFNTVAHDIMKMQSPALKNLVRVLQSAYLLNEDVYSALIQLPAASHINEASYIYNILLDRYAPFLSLLKAPNNLTLWPTVLSQLLTKAVGLRSIWKDDQHAKLDDVVKQLANGLFLSSHLAWVWQDYHQGQRIDYQHPVISSLLLEGNQLLFSLIEKLIGQTQLSESSLYYFLRQDGLQTIFNLATVISGLQNFTQLYGSQKLSFYLDAIKMLENALEIAYRYFTHHYSEQAEFAKVQNDKIIEQTKQQMAAPLKSESHSIAGYVQSGLSFFSSKVANSLIDLLPASDDENGYKSKLLL